MRTIERVASSMFNWNRNYIISKTSSCSREPNAEARGLEEARAKRIKHLEGREGGISHAGAMNTVSELRSVPPEILHVSAGPRLS
jgi:hypothetical protein